jgi:tRNA(fMet)-specific endonuclease VapC
MMQQKALLDSDILSAILVMDARVVENARNYYTIHRQFQFSIITRFEVLRGLKARGATAKLSNFESICQRNLILPLTDDVVEKGADIYADLHRRGSLIDDADILIAATALVHGLIMVTNNEKHYSRIPGLQIDNWLK